MRNLLLNLGAHNVFQLHVGFMYIHLRSSRDCNDSNVSIIEAGDE